MDILPRQFRIPSMYGDYWFNSDPIPVSALGGYVILVDFWDYTNPHSLASLPYVKEWNRRYAESGLILIGVHTPQFPFAADPMNVHAAIEELGIRYPVVMDNNYLVWNAFRNQNWPTRYLADKNGFIRYVHAGEGSYQNFEHALQSLLADAGYYGEMPIVMDAVREIDRPGAVCYRATPDILTGWQRGTLGNIEGFSPESTVHYEDPGVYIPGRIYLHGNWLNDRNFVRLNDPEGLGGSLAVVYEAKEVSMLLRPEGEKSFQVFVRHDDAYLTKDASGEDVQFDDEGRSYLIVDKAKLYQVIRNREYGEHKFMLTTRSNGFSIYAISFTSAIIPEMISNN